MSNPQPSPPPRRYILQQLLGEGGMSRVYQAHDRLTGETVAYKQLHFAEDLANDPDLLAEARLTLAREFQLLASLRHPHIVSVLDFGFTPQGQPFYTMLCLPAAQTIVQAAQTQPLPAQIALLAQLLQALAYLHRRQVVHCDLKPGNVLVCQGQVRVLDFGLAFNPQQRATSGGTLPYMAPELLQGQPPTPASDLYALGVILAEMLTGQLPLYATNVHRFMHAILHTSPDLSAVPAPMRPIVTRLLAKLPQDRYPSANAVLADLSPHLTGSMPTETHATRESFLQAAEFVGRTTELQQLLAPLQSTSPTTSGWLIGGESGVGKSRLLAEFRTHALIQGILCLPGQALNTGGVPYQIWHNIFNWLVVMAEPSDWELSVLGPFVPDLAARWPRALTPAPVLPPPAAQTRLFAVVTALLARLAAQQPLALLLEDLHWAGQSSLALLQHLLAHPTPWPVYVVASYRDDEMRQLPAQLPTLRPLPLQRLTPAAIAALSAAMLGPSGQQPHLVNFLARETEGNVFFLIEVMRALAERAGQLEEVVNLTLPAHIFAGGIRQIVQQRLSRIPQVAQALLQLAAVAGRQLDLRLLAMADPTLNLEAWLATCAEAAVLTVQDNVWHFAHDKLREGLQATLTPTQHQALHQQVAQLIEQVYPQDTTQAQALAYHWGMAQDPAREHHYAVLAGEHAAARFAHDKAIEFFTRALALTPAQALAPQMHLRRKLGQILAGVSRWPEAQHEYLAALALAQQLTDRPTQADCQQALGFIARQQGAYAAAAQWLDQAQANWAALGNTAGLGQVLAEVGNLAHLRSDYAEAHTQLTQSLTLARAAGDQRTEALALNWLGNVARVQGQAPQAQALYEASLAVCRALGDQLGIARALYGLATVAYVQHDYTTAQHYGNEGLAVYRQIGDRQGMAWALGTLGSIAHEQQNYALAHTQLAASLQLCRALGAKRGIALALVNLGHVPCVQGQYTAALPLYQESVQLFLELDDKQGFLSGLAGLARCAAGLQVYLPAAQLLAAIAHHTTLLNFQLDAAEQTLYDQALAQVQTTLPAAALAPVWQTGTQLTLPQALHLAQTLAIPHTNNF